MNTFGSQVLLGEGGVGIRGVRGKNMSCTCDSHSCQCTHHIFNGEFEVEKLDMGKDGI